MFSRTFSSPARSRGSSFWPPMLVIAAAQLIVIMNNAIVNIALPQLSADLSIGPEQQSWVITAYLLVFGSVLLVGGKVGDAFGHRRAFIGGLLGTAVFAGLAGAATAPAWYLLARAGQGLSAAVLAPAAVALLSTTFEQGHERAKAFGIYGAVTGAGAAIGVLAGGILPGLRSGRWTMFASVPLALLAAAAAPLVLSAAGALDRTRWHLQDVTMVVVGVAAFLLTLTELEHGRVLPAAALAVLAAVALIGFARRQLRSRTPLLPPELVADRHRLSGLIVVGAGGLGPTGVFVVLSLYLQQTLQMSPMQAALATLPYPIGMMVSSQLAERLIDRFGPIRVVIGALGLSGLGLLPMILAGPGASYAALVLPVLIAISLTMGPAFVAGSRLAMSGVAENHSGTMGAAMNSSAELGGAVGVTLLSAVALVLSRDGVPGYGAAMAGAGAILLVSAVAVALVAGVRRRART